MNWDYVAGFFDGEGCICCNSTKSRGLGFMVSFTQVDEKVLKEISQFLSAQGIRNGMACYRYKKSIGWVKPQFRLFFGSRAAVMQFLKNIWFRLRVKRQLAQDALRFLQMFGSLAGPAAPGAGLQVVAQ